MNNDVYDYILISSQYENRVYIHKCTAQNTNLTNEVISKNISVYPNPFINLLNINIESLNDRETAEITFFDALGKVVMKQKTEQIINMLDLSNLSSGIYYLTIKTNNEINHFKVLKH